MSTQVPFTRICVDMIVSGLPVGTHVDWLFFRSTGWPPAFTRVAALVKVAVAHGGEPEALKEHALTEYEVDCVATFCPPAFTR
jgi:hypothetical protein